MRVLRGAVIGVALVTGASGMVCEGQMSQQPVPSSGRISTGLPSIDGRKPGEPDPVSPAIIEQQARTRNNDRQKKMVQDTNRLVSLATDLKEQVGKSAKDTTAGDAAKKAEEIEKLAKSVRDRMKD
jgi:hypothetical protein